MNTTRPPRVKAATEGDAAKKAKVFWVFSSEKNIFSFFFFEKKKQKTFVFWRGGGAGTGGRAGAMLGA